MSENPYAAPETSTELVDHASDEERQRRQHLNTEASIRSIGTLYIAAGVLGGIGISRDLANLINVAEGLVLLLVFALLIALGIGLRKLHRLATIVAGIPAGLGLFLFPVGTIINVLILYSLFCKKARYVVTPQYREIIRATPHIRYRTSIVTWILVFILLALIFGGCFYAIRRNH